MFSQEIVCSEDFLDMPATTRDLYFQLGMKADDDGFIQPKLIMKMLGSSTDDLKILTAKRFIIPFQSGVVVIKHWLIHNMIRQDRYKQTRFVEEKDALFLKENNAYTDDKNKGVPLMATKWQPNGNQMAAQYRVDKVSIDTTTAQKYLNAKSTATKNIKVLEKEYPETDIKEEIGKWIEKCKENEWDVGKNSTAYMKNIRKWLEDNKNYLSERNEHPTEFRSSSRFKKKEGLSTSNIDLLLKGKGYEKV